MIICLNLQCGGRERRWFGDAAGRGVTRGPWCAAGWRRGAMVCQRGAVRVRRRGGLGLNARGRGAGPWCGACWRRGAMGCQRGAVRVRRRGGLGRNEGLALVWRHRGDGYFLQFTWLPNRPSRPLQGTSARAMVCRKIIEDQRPATHGPQSPVSARLGPVKARPYAFLQFTWHPNRPSRALQGMSARAMASICVHRASRTPPDSAPGHISSRDGLQEDY